MTTPPVSAGALAGRRPAIIGVNLLWLVPGVVGGSEEYTLRLLRALSEAEPADLRLRLYGQQRLFSAHPDLADRFETVIAPDCGGGKPGRVALEASWLALVARNDDLLHHGGGVVPVLRTTPSVVTVHDLQPLDLPQHFSTAKRRWLGFMIPRAVLAARLVLCPSRFTADRIVARFGLSPDRVVVVAQGLDSVEPGVRDPDLDRALRSDYGRFLLLPAIAYPHKRHADLVRTLDALRHHPDLSVVVTGRPGPETAAVERLATELGLDGRVHQLGRVPETRLDALYRSAAAMVFPSAYEGFGNPVLEAMARGCPVITSDATALPELVGDAGLVAPLGDVAALADAVRRILDDPALRARLATAGPLRAAQFSTASAAQQLATAYRRALAIG